MNVYHRKLIETAWKTIFGDLYVKSVHLPELDDIIQQYQGDGRYYHTDDHLHQVIDLLVESQVWSNASLLAAFYHDYIYCPGATDNEDQSAEICYDKAIKLGIEHDVAKQAAEMIRATKYHSSDVPEADQLSVKERFFLGVGRFTNIDIKESFLDADMAILGSDPDLYAKYIEGIRLEYSRFSDSQYRTGRLNFLNSLMSQTTIFITVYFKSRFESQARLNIQKEIHLLG